MDYVITPLCYNFAREIRDLYVSVSECEVSLLGYQTKLAPFSYKSVHRLIQLSIQ